MAQLVKNPPAMWETWVRSLGWEDPLEKGKAAHSSVLAWRIPWTVQSMGLQRVRQTERLSLSLLTLVRYNISRETLLILSTRVEDQFEIRKDKVKIIIIFVCSPNGVGREPEKNLVNQELSLLAEYS